jgi:diacylglycerol kinase family enzyme
MRVALIHNPVAGSGDHSGDTLLDRLRAAGHDAVYASTEAESLTAALNDEPEVVIAAGGDGTVAAVARLLAASGRDIPLGVLPMGTANNIARSIGVPDDEAEMVRSLATAHRRRFDVGIVRAPWGDSRFVESAGIGLFAGLLRDALRDEQAGVVHTPNPRNRGIRLAKRLSTTRGRECTVVADGEDLSGSYLMAVVLNVSSIGPALVLAPQADAGDGVLDLLLVREEDRAALGAYIESIARGDEQPLSIPTRRVTTVRLDWSSADGHIDDRIWPELSDDEPAQAIVEVGIADRPLQVLVPA